MSVRSSFFVYVFAVLLSITAASGYADGSKHDHSNPEPPHFTVYKSPTCGCCSKWIDAMQSKGFSLTAKNTNNLAALKKKYAIDPKFQSCHTAVTKQGYVFEGHVPAKFIQQFLQSPPKNARGLSVPNMPMGSPSMEMGDHFSPYQVFLLLNDGRTEVFAKVTRLEEQQ